MQVVDVVGVPEVHRARTRSATAVRYVEQKSGLTLHVVDADALVAMEAGGGKRNTLSGIPVDAALVTPRRLRPKVRIPHVRRIAVIKVGVRRNTKRATGRATYLDFRRDPIRRTRRRCELSAGAVIRLFACAQGNRKALQRPEVDRCIHRTPVAAVMSEIIAVDLVAIALDPVRDDRVL